MPKPGNRRSVFKKVLIANRGEIACRIIRTCHDLHIKTVAVYSEADASALHVKLADEAILIGPPPPSESYLNIERIIGAATETGAEAIHPGYGFLSENAAFVLACEKAGIRFIGPSGEVMELMKDKAKARKLAEAAGLPLLPGTDSENTNDQITTLAQDIGFPLMVKASYGGGGIGIRIVESPEQLLESIERASSLAQSAFGNSRLYLEKYLNAPSHVEVQILADQHGNAIHLFERDCSVQRRNQKIIEETPCVKLDDTQRQAMYQAALNLVHYIGYTNAGTVEFLVDYDGSFYFIEMNTRLQVEHPVTEMTTELDIVEWQLRIAAGEPLTFSQKDVSLNGHSVEARVYPEDPTTSLPTIGTVKEIKHPRGSKVRIDGSLFNGYEILPHYDALMAKVIAWGETREKAISTLSKALGEYRISGVTTNIPLVQRALSHPEFTSGTYSTQILSHLDGPTKEDPNRGAESEVIAAILAVLGTTFNTRAHPRDNRWKIYGRRRQMEDPSSRGGRW